MYLCWLRLRLIINPRGGKTRNSRAPWSRLPRPAPEYQREVQVYKSQDVSHTRYCTPAGPPRSIPRTLESLKYSSTVSSYAKEIHRVAVRDACSLGHLSVGGEEGTSPSSASPWSLSLIRCVLDTSTARIGDCCAG